MAPPAALEISFDLNKAAELSRNVASASYIADMAATLSTNANQWEPGEFNNGVTAFGSDNVFILHNAGTGSNQRFIYMAFSTQLPVSFNKVKFSAQSNGPIPSFIVESSPRSDFSLAVNVLGQIAGTTKQWADYTVTFDPIQIIEGTVTYIRIRITNAIPNGGNYVAYNNIKYSGTVQLGGGTSGYSLSAQSGTNRSTNTKVELLYDFNTAKELALNIAPAVAVTNNNSVLSTNASQWEPGQFNNGVTSFGLRNNVFILHNAGTASGTNQRYVFVALTTQETMVLNRLEVNVSSNAAGHGPSNPITIALEASATNDFATIVNLGSISTISGQLSLNMLLPRGTTYLRLRSISTIPDGSNYIAYDHLKLTCSIATDGWKTVGLGASYLLTVANMLFAVDQTAGIIKQYKGQANQWTTLAGTASRYHGTDAGLYAVSNDQSHVVQWNFATSVWDVIGPPMIKLFSGRNILHGIDAEGTVWMYTDTPNQWMRLGGPFRSVDANDQFCFAIPNDGQSVQMRGNSASATWNTIFSGGMAGIVASGNALYGLTGTGGLVRYNGTGSDWTNLPGGGFNRIIPQGTDLLALSADRYAVYRLRQGDTTWRQVGGPTDSLWANSRYVFGIQSGNVVLRSRQDLNDTNFWTGSIAPQTLLRTALDSPLPVPPPLPTTGWLFEFRTKDAMFAGYTGKIEVTLIDGLSYQSFDIGEHSGSGEYKQDFDRGEIIATDMNFSSRTLTSIQIKGEYHYLPDHWTVDKIWAWSYAAGVQYVFDVDADIPNINDRPGWLTLTPSFTKTLVAAPKPARIFFWATAVIPEIAAGHASMLLSDGTYISWWPENEDPEGMYFLWNPDVPLVTTRVFDQQYADDRTLEGRDADDIIAVYNLDEAAIKTWWIAYKNANTTYNLFTQNCSSIVYLALKAGGALNRISPGLQQRMEQVNIWLPAGVARLARLVQSGAPQWSDQEAL